MGYQVVVAEYDSENGDAIEARLTEEGYRVSRVRTAADAFYLASTHQFDLMVMGAGPIGSNRVQFLTSLRSLNTRLLVLMLLQQDSTADRIECLRAGADDCIVNPLSMEEFCAHVEALLRRGRLGQMVRLAVSDLLMDLGVRRVSRAGESIPLTGREFDVLETLMRRAHKIVPRDELARSVWQNVNRATPLDNVIDVHIGHLRKKIDKRGSLPLIHTARGIGFVLSDRQPQ